jgi:hypothetical protein
MLLMLMLLLLFLIVNDERENDASFIASGGGGKRAGTYSTQNLREIPTRNLCKKSVQLLNLHRLTKSVQKNENLHFCTDPGPKMLSG